MSLKLYFDFLSQPSRALYIILKLSNIPFEQHEVGLANGEHLSDEYRDNVSRFKKVPVLHDGDFKLTESVAILRYLSKEKALPEKWYPKNSKEQARVDEYLEWQHNNVRAFCSLYFRQKWMMPLLTGRELPPEKMAIYKKNMVNNLDSMEKLWFSSPYIAGNRITAADIWAACELEQPRIAGYDPAEGRPKLAAWWSRVKKELGPIYQEAHVSLNNIIGPGENLKNKL